MKMRRKKRRGKEASRMSQPVKALAFKPDNNLSSAPGTHVVEGELIPANRPLTSTCVLPNKHNKNIFKQKSKFKRLLQSVS